jgi:pimeloyl-ACP methyl ester carboxylesterase
LGEQPFDNSLLTPLATSYEEVPVFIAGDGADLFVVLTHPTTPSNGKVVILAWGAGAYPSCGRNQLRTRLARRLAAYGYHVIRMDYSGVGESSGELRAVSFDKPWTADVVRVCEWATLQTLGEIVLVGFCFGARNVLSSTPVLPSIAGVVLIGPPVRDQDHVETASRSESLGWHARHAFSIKTIRNIVKPRKRRKYLQVIRFQLRRLLGGRPSTPQFEDGHNSVSHHFLKPLRHLVKRKVPLLFVYGTNDRFWRDFQQGREVAFHDISAGFEVQTIDAQVNLQTDVTLQTRLIEIVEHWLAALTNRDPA